MTKKNESTCKEMKFVGYEVHENLEFDNKYFIHFTIPNELINTETVISVKYHGDQNSYRRIVDELLWRFPKEKIEKHIESAQIGDFGGVIEILEYLNNVLNLEKKEIKRR